MTIICFIVYKIPLHINTISLCCFNRNYDVTIVDYIWILKKVLTEIFLKISTLLNVKKIRLLNYKLNEFVFISLYFLNIDLRNYLIYIYIYQKLYLVKNLKANVFINNNILLIKKVIINFTNKIAIISSYYIILFVTIWVKNYLI